MTIIISVIFLGLIIFAIIDDAKESDKNEIPVLYGYPSNSNTWLTLYYNRKTNGWIFEWDDLFDSGRGKEFGDIKKSYMYPNRKDGATEEEIEDARRILSETYPQN